MKTSNGSNPIEQVKEAIESLTRAPYEIFYIRKNNETIESKDETIDGYETAVTEGISIRILDKGKMGFGYSTRLDTEGIHKMVRQALESLNVSSEDPAYGFLDPSAPYPTLSLHDSSLLSLTADQKKELTISIEQAARSFDTRIKQVRNAQVSIREARVRLYNALELDRSYTLTGISASIMLTAEDADASEYGWESISSHFLKDIPFKEIGKGAAKKAINRLGSRPAPSGQYPAILDREVVAEIVALLSSSFTGENLYKKKSVLKDKEGQEVFSRHLTLYDGLLFEEGMAAAPFDGEGEPAQNTLLVDHGVVVGFLFDHYYGKKVGKVSTANSVRSGISTPPACGTTNLTLAPGEIPLKDMVGSISDGFFIQELMGVHTANPITGEFSLGASGQRIENGKLTYPVHGVAISGNLFDLLKRVEEVGSDLRWFDTIGVPHLLIGALNVAGSRGD